MTLSSAMTSREKPSLENSSLSRVVPKEAKPRTAKGDCLRHDGCLTNGRPVSVGEIASSEVVLPEREALGDSASLAGTEGMVDDQPVASAAMFGTHEQRTRLAGSNNSFTVAGLVQIDDSALPSEMPSVQLARCCDMLRRKFGIHSRVGTWLAWCQIASGSAPTKAWQAYLIEASGDGNASPDGMCAMIPGIAWQTAR